MPVGAFAGRRAKYIYTADAGAKYVIRTSKILGDLVDNGLVAFDPTNTTHQGYPNLPKGFKPRHVYWVPTGTVPYPTGKRLIAGTNNCKFFKRNGVAALTIDTQVGELQGRVGEAQSYY